MRDRVATDTDGLLLGDLALGTRVGDYRLEGRLVGRGTGLMYQAAHVMLPRRVAIKVMPMTASQPTGLELLREACIVEALDHPGIPRLYECGVLPDRRAWIATELFDGATLADHARDTRMSPLDIALVLRDVANILDHAHTRGLVHCNLLPTTILIPTSTRRFPLCISDWSGARTHDMRSPVPLSSAAARPYAAPEQTRGESFDGSADIYALGVIAFEILRGRDVPPMLTMLLRQMISTNPTDRPTAAKVWQSAVFLIDELEAAPVESPDEDTQVVTPPPPPAHKRSRVITSDLVAQVSGELEVRRVPPNPSRPRV